MSGGSASSHAFASFHGRTREGLAAYSRRGMLKTGLAGIAGLTLPDLLRLRAEAAQAGRAMGGHKSVILLWMAGGPSHIDTLDPKPDQPENKRGPFGTIPTTLPGVHVCEHLPKYAKLTDKLTIIRSVDCRGSNHQPNTVMQTGFRAAAPRANREGAMYPAMGSLVGKNYVGRMIPCCHPTWYSTIVTAPTLHGAVGLEKITIPSWATT